MTTCCNEVTLSSPISLKLVKTTLYVTQNGITQPIDFSGISGSSTLSFNYIPISVTSNSQTYFTNVIPLNETLLEISVNGISYYEEVSYTVLNSDIVWIGEFILETTDSVVLKTTYNVTV